MNYSVTISNKKRINWKKKIDKYGKKVFINPEKYLIYNKSEYSKKYLANLRTYLKKHHVQP